MGIVERNEGNDGTRGIRMITRGIRVGTREIRVETRGIRAEMQGMGVGMLGMRGMWGIRVGMRGIKMILSEILYVYCFGKNLGAQGEHFTIHHLWAAARLLVTRILPSLPSG